MTTALTKIVGTVIGSAGSYQNAGNTIAKAFDGSLTSFYDAAATAGDWCGQAFGSPVAIAAVAFAPRAEWPARMVGGHFQASNSANFSSGVVTLYTVPATPPVGVLTTVPVTVAGTYSFGRYIGPPGSSCNVAEVQFLGTAAPASQVSPAAATAPALMTCGTGATASTRPNGYTTNPAPTFGWFDTRPLTPTLSGYDRQWTIKCPAGYTYPLKPNPKHALDPVAYPSSVQVDPTTCIRDAEALGFYFDTPGQYVVTCDITCVATGVVTTATQNVTVPPDGRARQYFSATGNDSNSGTAAAPWLSAAKYAKVAAQPNTWTTLLGGYKLDVSTLPASIRMRTNFVVDGQPDANGNPATLVAGGQAIFDGWAGQTAGGVIRNLEATSVGTPATANGVTYMHAPGSAELLFMRGENIGLFNVSAGCLTRLAEMNDTAPDGFAIWGCTESADGLSISGQVLSVWGEGTSGKVSFAFNRLTGAVNEGVDRWDGTNSGNGTYFGWNYVVQTNPAAGDKAGRDVRNCFRFVDADSAYGNAPISWSTTLGTTTTKCQDARTTRAVFRVLPGAKVPFTAWVGVGDRSDGIQVTNCDFGPPTPVPGTVAVATTTGTTNVVVAGNNR